AGIVLVGLVFDEHVGSPKLASTLVRKHPQPVAFAVKANAAAVRCWAAVLSLNGFVSGRVHALGREAHMARLGLDWLALLSRLVVAAVVVGLLAVEPPAVVAQLELVK